jgi:SAM-dependent methyltransferase
MRDPAGGVSFETGTVVRHIKETLDDDHFLFSELAHRWVERGDLVPFTVDSPRRVTSPRLPFVTQPTEWCDAQFHQAAQLTLRLQREAVEAGFDLKDASAWNIIFDGTRPIFCDLLSLEPLRTRQWLAAGQFARHFVLPLLLSQRKGFRAHESFKAWRDGVPPNVAGKMIGLRRYLTRYWPLMHSGAGATAVPAPALGAQTLAAGFRHDLHAGLDWLLAGVAPAIPGATKSVWSHYTDERGHYTPEALAVKRQAVASWLGELHGTCVLDIGCNAGEFSRLALEGGGRVIALDADHDAITQVAAIDSKRLSAAVVRLDDLTDGRGWLGQEHPGLRERLEGQVDVALMLAVVHHLAVGASVPLDRIPDLVTSIGARRLVLEVIGERDQQMQLLCSQFGRSAAEFSIDRQLAAFGAAGFLVLDSRDLPGMQRQMVLMHRA